MPDNHFENKAKYKLDELKFSPSEAVWLHVQAQIKKDKNRRRLLLWLPITCLLLGAGTWYLLPGKSKIQQAHEIGTLSEKEKRKTDHAPEIVGSVKNKAAVPDESGIPTGHPPASAQQQVNRSGYMAEKKRSQTEEIRQNSGSQDASGANASVRISRAEKRNQKKTVITAEQQTNTSTNNPENKKSGDDGINQMADSGNASLANKPLSSKTDSALQPSLSISKTGREDSLKNNANKKTNTRKKNTIQWGIIGGAGLSSHFIKFRNNNPVYASSNSGIPANNHSLPSEKQSASFYIGLRLQKTLNRTTQIFTGLQYTYSGVKIARGNLVNMPAAVYAANYSLTNINSYYPVSGTDNYNYTNQYHFVEIPLGIEKQLGQKSRFSVNAGISVAWLLFTRALQYDPQTRIYFKENSYFNRTQWNVLGGIQYRLLQKEKYALKIGPQLQYGLSGLLNRKSPYAEHQFFGGFQILITRNRK